MECLCPQAVKWVVYWDDVNRQQQTGAVTQAFPSKPIPTREEYLAKYARQGEHGLYFYVEG
jgi:hypothetical protein